MEDEDYHFTHSTSSFTPSTHWTRSHPTPDDEKSHPRYVSLNKLDIYNFKIIVHYNFTRGLSCEVCIAELRKTFETLMPEPATIKGWYEKLEHGLEIRELNLSGGRPRLDHFETQILELLNDNPYYSLRRMSSILKLSKETLKRIIHEKLGMKKVSTRWVPHILTQDQMQARVEQAQLMKGILLKNKQYGFLNIVTGDESWFYLFYPPSSKWIKKEEDRPVMESMSHLSKKVMVTICFSSTGLRHLFTLPHGQTMNAKSFVDYVLKPVEKSYEMIELPPDAPCLIHYDNARVHLAKHTADFLQQSSLVRIPHPPYSPDISPCDFFLFGYIKHLLTNVTFADEDSLEKYILSLAGQIPKSKYLDVFNHWIDRLDYVIESGGKYFDKKYSTCPI
jgi:histone-lysine N-methyltransferase SETMAR